MAGVLRQLVKPQKKAMSQMAVELQVARVTLAGVFGARLSEVEVLKIFGLPSEEYLNAHQINGLSYLTSRTNPNLFSRTPLRLLLRLSDSG